MWSRCEIVMFTIYFEVWLSDFRHHWRWLWTPLKMTACGCTYSSDMLWNWGQNCTAVANQAQYCQSRNLEWGKEQNGLFFAFIDALFLYFNREWYYIPFAEECVQGFGGKTRRKEQLGRPRGRWKKIIKMDLRDIRYKGMDWINLTEDRDQWGALDNMVTDLQVSQNFGKFLNSRATDSSLRRNQLHGVSQLIN
jgi:hypothetical protein